MAYQRMCGAEYGTVVGERNNLKGERKSRCGAKANERNKEFGVAGEFAWLSTIIDS